MGEEESWDLDESWDSEGELVSEGSKRSSTGVDGSEFAAEEVYAGVVLEGSEDDWDGERLRRENLGSGTGPGVGAGESSGYVDMTG